MFEVKGSYQSLSKSSENLAFKWSFLLLSKSYDLHEICQTDNYKNHLNFQLFSFLIVRSWRSQSSSTSDLLVDKIFVHLGVLKRELVAAKKR